MDELIAGVFCYYCCQTFGLVRAKILDERVIVETGRSVLVGEPGDYIIVGNDGKLYPLDKQIFESLFDKTELVDDGLAIKEFKFIHKTNDSITKTEKIKANRVEQAIEKVLIRDGIELDIMIGGRKLSLVR
jgi:hypothetical protein